jgi:hypothetical protein
VLDGTSSDAPASGACKASRGYRRHHFTGRMNSARPASGAKPSDALVHRDTRRCQISRHLTLAPASGAAQANIWCYRKQHFRLRFFTSGPVENSRFTSQKASNPASQAQQEGERNSNPSLPLKLHHLHKCANITKCTSPCACVLAFS